MGKFRAGDTIISGPYVFEPSGKPIVVQASHYEGTPEIAKISKDRGSHVLLSVVLKALPTGITVSARYIVWDDHIEPIREQSFLHKESDDYRVTDLLDRERNNVQTMVEFLQHDGQREWLAEHKGATV